MAMAAGGKGAAPAATNPLTNPNATLSGNSLFQAAQALANAQVQAPLTELARQIAQQQSQTKNALNLTGGYFNQLGQYGQQAFNDQQQVASGLNSTLSGISGQENQQLQGVAQNGVNQMQRYSPGIGTSGPGMQSLTTELARQQGLAAQNEGAFRSFGATQGANYAGLSAAQLGVGAQRGQEMLGDIGRAGQLAVEPLTNKVAALEAQKGALIATNEGKLRQQEINNQIARAGLGIKQQSLNATIQNNNTRNALTARGQDITAHYNNGRLSIDQQNANTNSQNAATRSSQAAFANNPNAVGSVAWYRSQQIRLKGANGGLHLTAGQNAAGARSLGQVINAIQTWQQGGIKNSKGQVLVAHPNDNQMKQVLGGKYDPNLIEAALELLGYGSLDARTASALQSTGYNISAGWTFRGRPIKVTATYNPNNPGNNAAGSVAQGVANGVNGAF